MATTEGVAKVPPGNGGNTTLQSNPSDSAVAKFYLSRPAIIDICQS